MSERPNKPSDEADDTSERQATRPLETVTPASGTRRRTGTSPAPQATPRSNVPVSRPLPYSPPPPAGSPYATSAPTTSRTKSKRPQNSGLYLPWWSLLIMLALVVGLAAGALVVVGSLGGQSLPGGRTPVFIVITATYTVGPPASVTPIPQPATDSPPPPLPTIAPSASLPPGDI